MKKDNCVSCQKQTTCLSYQAESVTSNYKGKRFDSSSLWLLLYKPTLKMSDGLGPE